jgi:hypothetical protein
MHLKPTITGFCALVVLAVAALAAELNAPAQVAAGSGFAISSAGSGEATLYLVGPSEVVKRKIQLGSDVQVQPEEVERAGEYTAIVCSSQCSATHFYVHAADGMRRLSFIVHPSRVPVKSANAISAVAFVFDKFRNLVLSPEPVEFHVRPQGGKELSQARPTQNGVAWIRLTSATQGGATKIGASIGDTNEQRVVQQVASEACNLRIKQGGWEKHQLWVETDPVRDCSGNPVPDGTVVSFTMIDGKGKTTVDAPIKRGIAKVQMPVSGNARITVASGVVTGNELHVAGGQ